MARPPLSEAELIARYGPHLNEAPPGGWSAGLQIDKVSKLTAASAVSSAASS
jgi:hypothetical protein